MPILQHSSRFAQLNVRQHAAQLSVQQRPAQLNVSRTGSSLNIQSTPGQLSVDSTQTRASMHYYTMLGLLGELVGYTQRQYNRGVSEIVADGAQFQSIEHKGNPIASVARERMFVDMNDREFRVGLMPSVPPSISYSPGSVSIQVNPGSTQVQIQSSAPMINVEPQRAEISVQPGQLQMNAPPPAAIDLLA